MSHFENHIYGECRFSIGDVNFLFFPNTNSVGGVTQKSLLHSHKLYELFHVLHGEMSLITDSETKLINQGNTVIVAPGTIHTTRIHPAGKRFGMMFSIEKNQTLSQSNYYDVFLKILSENITNFDSPLLAPCFERCAQYVKSDYSEKNELITACLHEIMALVKATSPHEENLSPTNTFSDTDKSRIYLIDHYFSHSFRHGSLTELSESLQLSVQQTQRIIKKIYGQSFSERLTIMKMELAKTLLQDTNLPIAEIAEKCGYTGPNGFFVAFKKYYGKTPNKLKNECVKG